MARRFSLDAAIKKFRDLVFGGVREALDAGRVCRPYEGQVSVAFPSYIDAQRKSLRYSLRLSGGCLGKGNHHAWSGRSWEDVFDLAEQDVREWIAENRIDTEGE